MAENINIQHTLDDHTGRLNRLEIQYSELTKQFDRMLDSNASLNRSIQSLTLSVNTMNTYIEQLREESLDYESRVRTLESEPGKMWNTLKTIAITAIISGLIGYLVTRILFG